MVICRAPRGCSAGMVSAMWGCPTCWCHTSTHRSLRVQSPSQLSDLCIQVRQPTTASAATWTAGAIGSMLLGAAACAFSVSCSP